MIITQTMDIPIDHRLIINVPREVPAGRAQVEVKVIPFVKKDEEPETPLKTLKGTATPLADSLLGVVADLGSITLDEIKEEKLAKHLI